MRYDRTPTDRSSNFEDRLKQTQDSELDPEMVTPNTAGEEETPDHEENFPLTKQFRQTNMRGRRGKSAGCGGSEKDQQR
jgi:hypothetical protein